MKKQLFILLFFTLCFVQAQTPADKKTVLLDYRIDFAKPPRVYKYPVVVYLKDYETKQPITQANVTLEGYLLKDIKAKYNKKEGYFYFKKLPKGYNTIMANAENYNPKGLQNTEKLPQEITLELHDPMNMVYNFQQRYYTDSENERMGYKTKDNYHYNIYVEDPYKIIIDCPKSTNRLNETYNNRVKIDSIYTKRLDSLAFALGLERVNKLSLATMDCEYSDKFLRMPKHLMIGVPQDSIYKVYVESGGGWYRDELVYCYKNQANIYKRKDNKPFKRFNCPIIKAIKETIDFDVFPVIYHKMRYSSSNKYDKEKFSFLNCNLKTELDKATYIWYRTDLDSYDIKSLTKNKERFDNSLSHFDNKYLSKRLILLNLNPYPVETKNMLKESEQKYFFDNNFCGLGLLDLFEHYERENPKEFYTNTIGNQIFFYIYRLFRD